MARDLDELIGKTLQTELIEGDIVDLPARHSTNWRSLPFFIFSQAWSGSECILLSNGQRIEAKKGEMIVLPSGIRHKVDVTSIKERRHWAHANYTVMHGIDLFAILQCPVLIDRGVGKAAGGAILDWSLKLKRSNVSTLERAALQTELGGRLLALIAPNCSTNFYSAERSENIERLGTVLGHMHKDFKQPLRRDELARMAGLSPAQFHVVFRNLMRVRPMEYLRKIRLRHAQQLLLTTILPVKEISCHCGYPDQLVFCKWFKHSCGYTPTLYRQSVRYNRAVEGGDGASTPGPAGGEYA